MRMEFGHEDLFVSHGMPLLHQAMMVGMQGPPSTSAAPPEAPPATALAPATATSRAPNPATDPIPAPAPMQRPVPMFLPTCMMMSFRALLCIHIALKCSGSGNLNCMFLPELMLCTAAGPIRFKANFRYDWAALVACMLALRKLVMDSPARYKCTSEIRSELVCYERSY